MNRKLNYYKYAPVVNHQRTILNVPAQKKHKELMQLKPAPRQDAYRNLIYSYRHLSLFVLVPESLPKYWRGFLTNPTPLTKRQSRKSVIEY